MKIGFIAGAFDCLHPGYIKMFDQMKEQCDQVYILLQSDPTIERPEKLKPILSVEERIDMLMSLRQIDMVQTYTLESDLYNLLIHFERHNESDVFDSEYIRFLGDDYVDKSFTGDDLNIPIKYLNRDHGWSTKKYKKLIADEVQRSSNI